MQNPIPPLKQSAKAPLRLLLGNITLLLGTVGVKIRMILLKASRNPRMIEACERACDHSRNLKSKMLNLLGKATEHPRVVDTRESCGELWSDLKELSHHPKVLTWKEHLEQRMGEMRQQAELQIVGRVRSSLSPRYLAMVAGAVVAVLIGLLATKAVKHSQRIQTQAITREASLAIRKMRLQQSRQSLDNWSAEQEDLQRALKALEESLRTGAGQLLFGGQWS